MVRMILICALVCVLGVNMSNCKTLPTLESTNQLREIIVVKDISNFARTHPGLKLIRLAKQSGKTRDQSVKYTLGAHISNDRLVAQAGDVFAYPAKKDVAVQLEYPQSGKGSILTYIDITCNQDNPNGNAYVVAGGIGQRFISIILEASQTETFSYMAQYYGTD